MSVMELFRVDGQVAVVTGGYGHLGRAICHALVEAGADVAVTGRNQEKCAELTQELKTTRSEARLMAIELDISNRASVHQAVEKISAKLGSIDILINNAYFGAGGALESMTDEEWSTGIDGGLHGAFRCMSEVIPVMRKQGSGVILNVASMYGLVSPDPRIYRDSDFLNPANYGAAKAGLIQFTRYAACHLGQHGIRVNAISPGPFPSDKVQKEDWFVEELASRTPLGRIGQPSELGGAILFLCSNAASYVTGQNLVVDGGWTAW